MDVDKIIKMVEGCTTKRLKELSILARQKPVLINMMIELAINHELEKRGVKGYRQDIIIIGGEKQP